MARFSVVTILSCLVGVLPLSSQCQTDQDPATTTAACAYLESVLGSTVRLPTDMDFKNASEANWVSSAWESPVCILQPTTAEEISQAVKYLVPLNVNFAIRSGGHSPAPFAANINDGVLFDMSGFNMIEYQEENDVAVVGTGLRWGEVYSHLDSYNVTVVGGRIVDVGVGGLALGSGLSYLTDLYGLVCDNVVNFEVVLADGSIVNANATSNSDLWWSLKGGANNFGIVTKFTLNTYPTGDVWGGQKWYTADQLPDLIHALHEYQSGANKDPYANLMMQAYPLNESIGVEINFIYNKPVASPEVFAAFYDIPTTYDTTQIQPMTDYLASQVPAEFPRLNWYATSFKVDAALFDEIGDIVTTAPELDVIRNLTAGSIAVGWQPISTTAVEAGIARGGNALGLENVNQTWLVIDIGWWFAEDDDVANSATLSLIDKIEAASTAADKYVDYIFMNDAAVVQDVISHYGAESVTKLLAAQAKYDPNRVFQELVPGGFKLPTAISSL
ncbi:putative FAD-binding oxidoreductase [Xylariaceae sp. FL1272]|nr:putative FAD-binding oxidoreductase [Xylariaceae sp. FL1272]